MGNPKSPWYATLQAKRIRKLVTVTLSDDARDRLAELAESRNKTKSEVVEALILGTDE